MSISLGIIQYASWNWVSLRCLYQLATASFLTATRLHASCLNNNAATAGTGRAQCLQQSTDHTLSEYSRSCWGSLVPTVRVSCLNRCLNRTKSKKDILITIYKLLWKPFTCSIHGLSQCRELKHIQISATKLAWTEVLTYSNLNSTLSQQSD